jgi:SSS family solute:Na+ symporter
VVGYLASLLFNTPLADKELTIWGYLEEKEKSKNVNK